MYLSDSYPPRDGVFRKADILKLTSVSAFLSPQFWCLFEQRFSVGVANIYGLTETVSAALCAGRHPEVVAIETIGKPIDCEARISAGGVETGCAAPTGEIQIKVSNLLWRYWQKSRQHLICLYLRELVQDG